MAFELPGSSEPSGATRAVRRRDQRDFAFEPGTKPHDLDTERAVLSGIFLDSAVLIEIQNVISETDFFLPAHQNVFGCMRKLMMKSVPIDIMTVQNYLRDEGLLELVGGPSYLAQIVATNSTTHHAIEYAKSVKDLAWRRHLIEAADFVKSAALMPGDTRDIASEIEKKVFGATQEKKQNSVSKLADLLPVAIGDLEKLTDQAGQDIGVKTGLTDLDECLAGLRPGQLVVLAAGPGMGKTSLAANLMIHASLKQAKNVLFFSLEMIKAEVVNRILSFSANIDATKLRFGNLSSDDYQELFRAADELAHANLFIDDRSVVTPYDVLATARKMNHELGMQNRGKLDLIVVDYIQIMKAGANVENRALEIAQITGGLKAIAKDIGVPVFALSQLNRDRNKRADSKKPILSDLKDSGAIEADADVVLFIHREQGQEHDSREAAEAEIIVAKQRSGPTKSIRVTWLGHLTKFSDWVDGGNAPPEYQVPAYTPPHSGNA